MKLILRHDVVDKTRKSPLQERFDKLMAKLNRQQSALDKFKNVLDELVEEFQKTSLESSRSMFDDLVALTEKLTVFASRKSLSNYHRDELLAWVQELVETRISPIDIKTGERLRDQYNAAIAHAMDMSVEEFEESLEEERRAFDEWLEEEETLEEEMEGDFWQEDLFGHPEYGPDSGIFDTEDIEPDARDESGGFGRLIDSQCIFEGDWAKTLFRRAAKVLHPDREQDPELRRMKQDRMRDLLDARKKRDIVAMLEIVAETTGDEAVLVAETEMGALCDALEQRMADLRIQKLDHIHSHPVRELVYEFCYHSSEKQRRKKLREWEKHLQQEHEMIRAQLADLRNLTVLKEALKERYEQRMEMGLDGIFFDFDL